MSGDVLQDDKPQTRGRANAMNTGQAKVDPRQIAWVTELTGAGEEATAKAEKDKKRTEAIGGATVGLKLGSEGLKGLDFEMMIKKDANFKSKAMALFGKQGSMKSLTGTGDAMNEIDTVHDKDKLEAIDGKKMKAANDSLQLVAEASQQLDGELMKLYADEFDVDPKDFERLQHMRKQEAFWDEEERKPSNAKKVGEENAKAKRPKRTDEEKAELEEFEKLRAKVEKEVRDEVWQPLVRQGLIPENMVPDIHSEVSRTFEGASEEYQARLEEYTKEQGDNANLIGKLKLGQKVIDQGLKVVGAIAEAVPGADVAKHLIETGVECATILSDTAFQVAGQILQKDEALNIAQTIAGSVSGIMKATGYVPEEVQMCVNSGIQIALTGGKAIKGIMDGKPEDVLAAVSSGLLQSLSLAADVSGNPNVAMASQAAAAGIATGAKAGVFIKLMMRKNPKPTKQEIQDALADVVSSGLQSVATAVSLAMQAEQARGNVSGDTADTVDQAMQIGTDGVSGLVGAALSKNKAAALAKALGSIANDCCSAYMPGAYGPEVGAILKKSISGTPELAEAIASGKPDVALEVFGGMLATGLTKASKISGVDGDVAEGLKDAGKAIKALKSEVKGLREFKDAVEAGNVAGLKKAGNKIINSLMDPLLEQLDPDALSDDGTLMSDDEDEEEEEDADASADVEADFAAKRRATIARNDAILKKGGTPQELEKAKAERDTAVRELLERKAFTEEVAADAKDFEAMLNSDLDPAAEDDGDTRTLEKLVQTIQRDRKIMQMADALIGMGIKAAAAFFAPVGIAMDFKTFAVEASKAVAHLQQLIIWKKNASEARNAVTVQVHTMLNRVGLEEDAVIEHQTKATLALISGIGNIIATAGAHAAPAGVAIAAAAKVASAALELALTIKSAAEMEIAWAQYQKALENPKDRKEIRMALQKNATMAKYALVWGALNDGNPIAKKALKRCGLTDAIIAKESANVKGVVEYLEVLYNDDPIVLRAVPDKSGWGWEPPKVALSLKVWTEFLSVAQSKGKPKLMAGSGGAITAAFGGLDPARAALVKAEAAHERITRFVQAETDAQTEEEVQTDPKDREKAKGGDNKRLALLKAKQAATAKIVASRQADVLAALTAIGQACVAFKPLDVDGNAYPMVVDWVVAVAALAELDARELAGEDVGLDVGGEKKAA